MSGKLKVTQIRSVVGRPQPQRDTIRGLGLKRMHHVVVKEDRPEIRGMLRKVAHLVEVEEIPGTTGGSRAAQATEQP